MSNEIAWVLEKKEGSRTRTTENRPVACHTREGRERRQALLETYKQNDVKKLQVAIDARRVDYAN